ncbi:interleukin-17 receptor A-like [Xenopus laevis]|uniref:Interleukin-17 receptor A-like n=1 Tax=Xenopus laevis TaxID=8355 RepID=A0A8J1MIT9_XENLA|nr:interleukin-17 receptor A-like [Xenopus laevis]
MAPGGTAGQLLALTLWLGLLTCPAQGFRIVTSDYNCSLPEVTCSVLNSNCINSSWIHPSQWTPSAPSNLEVVLVVEVNESGTPCQCSESAGQWPLMLSFGADWFCFTASILGLLGAEVSVMQRSTNEHLCVQLQFENQFPEQLMSDNKG